MTKLHAIKTTGYLISSISVLLLGAVALHGARHDPMLLGLVIAGMATSMLGMAMRWWTYQVESVKRGD